MLVMPDLALEWGFEVAERIRTRVEATDFSETAEGLAVTLSIGLALREQGESAGSWQQRADQALYRAKDGGRNRTVVSDDPAAAATDPRLAVVETGATASRTESTSDVVVGSAESTKEIPSDLLD